MRADRMRTIAPLWLRIAFALPLVGVMFFAGRFGTAQGYVISGVSFILLSSYLLAWPTRMLSLFMCVLLWLAALIWAVRPLAWFGLPLIFILSAILFAIAVRIAQPWGWQRYDQRAAKGRPMREWQWVYTGPAFARGHRLSQSHGPVLFVIAWVTVTSSVQLYFMLSLVLISVEIWGQGWMGAVAFSLLCLLVFLFAVFAIFTILFLWRRNTAAWFPTWVFLLLGFPLTLPLIVYWADGVRPNLVYRHRFERLIPLPKATSA